MRVAYRKFKPQAQGLTRGAAQLLAAGSGRCYDELEDPMFVKQVNFRPSGRLWK